MGVTIDTSELRALENDLARAAGLSARDVRPIVSKGALNIKNQMRREFGKSDWFSRASFAVSYDVTTDGDAVEAEIGPDKERNPAGALANIAYFGGARGGGGTVPDPQGALDAEQSRFEAAIEALAGDVL